MHVEAFEWVSRYRSSKPVTVLDIGGRDVNGTVRSLFPHAAEYVVTDILPGDGVDIVADASTWTPDRQYDVVVCCETFEHTADWPKIVATAYEACKPGGRVILTMAGPGRPEHSAIDGGWVLHDGEYYGNVDPAALYDVLADCGWRHIMVDQQFAPCDVRATAVK